MESKENRFVNCMADIKALLSREEDIIANMANVSAVLYSYFHHHWIGFYRVDNEELILGPFQGPLACTRIAKGKGVCGTSFALKKTIIVPDVHAFEGHIACSSLSNSEIVVPLIKNDKVIAVLDIDSESFNAFDETDQFYLEEIVRLMVD